MAGSGPANKSLRLFRPSANNSFDEPDVEPVWPIKSQIPKILGLNPDHRRLAGPFVAAWLPNRLLAGVIALVAVSGCTRFAMLNAIVPHCDYVRTRDLAYGADPRQKLDVYRSTTAQGPSDVVIFFYGGDWQNGQKEDYRFVAQALASRGFVAVIPNYRLYPQVAFPAFVQDGAAAVRWVHVNISRFGGDSRRIFLMGHSAGAHIAALLTLDGEYLRDVGLDRSAICATAGLSGPYDFVPPPDDRGAFSMPRDDATPDPRIEPISFVDGRAPPMLLVQGSKDQTVDPGNISRLADRILRRRWRGSHHFLSPTCSCGCGSGVRIPVSLARAGSARYNNVLSRA